MIPLGEAAGTGRHSIATHPSRLQNSAFAADTGDKGPGTATALYARVGRVGVTAGLKDFGL